LLQRHQSQASSGAGKRRYDRQPDRPRRDYPRPKTEASAERHSRIGFIEDARFHGRLRPAGRGSGRRGQATSSTSPPTPTLEMALRASRLSQQASVTSRESYGRLTGECDGNLQDCNLLSRLPRVRVSQATPFTVRAPSDSLPFAICDWQLQCDSPSILFPSRSRRPVPAAR